MTPASPPGTRGVTVVETAAALALTLLLLTLMTTSAVRQRAAGERTARRSEVVEARRVARDLLELAVADGGARNIPGEELGLRLFVGWARPCGGGSWRYRGRRRPDPRRDSLWLVSPWGEVRAAPLVTATPGSCPDIGPGETALVMEADSVPGEAILIRVFESGRFRLGDAFRYGRTGDPAQPLTGAVLDPTVSGLEVAGDRVRVTIAGADDSVAVSRSWSLR